MIKKVCHMLVKDGDLKSSFIFNQLIHHQDYEAYCMAIYSTLEGNSPDCGPANGCFKIFEKKNLLMNSWLRQRVKLPSGSIHKARKFLQEKQIDILHFHYGMSACQYRDLLSAVSIPSVVSFYGYDCHVYPFRNGGKGLRYLQKFVFPKVDVVLAMSEAMRTDLIKLDCPENKIRVHYHGIPLAKFSISRLYTEKSTTDFLMLSRLSPGKGHLIALQAFKQAFAVNPEIRVKIIGAGICQKEITALIRKNNLNFISLAGSVQYASAEHLHALEEADVFLHPSITGPNGSKEGIPGSLVEAMAVGLPVIATPMGGIPEIVDDGVNGLIVKENDVESLAEAILSLSHNADLRNRLGQAAAETARTKCNLAVQETELESIYDELISSRKVRDDGDTSHTLP